jgi:TfoX/Sxy family transcriptional regulator of competence genes
MGRLQGDFGLDLPRPSEAAKRFFKTVVPTGSTVTVRPMFGNDAAFTNGNMFMGLFGEDLFVHLPQTEGLELLNNKGARHFEPMKGRPMKGYFVVPREWRSEPDSIRKWVTISLSWANRLPPKKRKN